jgi:hypothetical protein
VLLCWLLLLAWHFLPQVKVESTAHRLAELMQACTVLSQPTLLQLLRTLLWWVLWLRWFCPHVSLSSWLLYAACHAAELGIDHIIDLYCLCSDHRFDLEDGAPVLYLYELQLEEALQRKGVGKFLMLLQQLLVG